MRGVPGMTIIHAVDLFAGAGGTSTGLILACESLERGIDLLAVNHWEEAIKAHEANYPWARHKHSRIEALRPREEVPGGHLDILVASPECTYFSTARGGRPINDQRRASPWHVLPWLQELEVDGFVIENVPEFRNWGPLNRQNRPMKAQRGETYKAWLNACRSLGYTVDAQILNSADFGDATSRRRLFVQGRRGRKAVAWPTPMFSRYGKMPGTKPWRAAKEVIDWSLRGESIFGRKKPLSPRTIARIMKGLRRFGGPAIQPFILPYFGERKGQKLRMSPIGEPMPTVTSHGAGALVEPILIRTGWKDTSRAAPKPVSTEPVPTVTGSQYIGLAEAFILPPEGFYRSGGNVPRSVEDPLPTITAGRGNQIGLAQPFLIEMEHGGNVRSVNDPLPTITTARGGAMGVAEGVLVQYNGMSEAQPVTDPMPTVTTKDRLGLVVPVTDGYRLDIRFRMLQPHELAAAMGFPKDYYFADTRTDTVKMIGNAVSVQLAKALCTRLLTSSGRGGLEAV